jgi:hypothetical protein
MVTSRPVRLSSAAACTIAMRVRSFWLPRPVVVRAVIGRLLFLGSPTRATSRWL